MCLKRTWSLLAGKSPVGLRGTIQEEFSQTDSAKTIRKDVGVCQPGDPGVILRWLTNDAPDGGVDSRTRVWI